MDSGHRLLAMREILGIQLPGHQQSRRKSRRATEAARAAWRGRFTLARYQREMIAVMEQAASSEQPPE